MTEDRKQRLFNGGQSAEDGKRLNPFVKTLQMRVVTFDDGYCEVNLPRELKYDGVSFFYPSRYHVISNEMRQFFPEDRLEHLKHVLSGRVENSLYIDTLCVDEKFRENAIGGKLISMTKKKAAEEGSNALSLIALADNTSAHRLYYRCGFEIVSNVEMASHELIPHEGGAYLMCCNLE